MPRDLMGSAVLALGLMVVVAASIVSPPQPAARHIWVVSASDQISSRPTLVRAAYPDRKIRLANAK